MRSLANFTALELIANVQRIKVKKCVVPIIGAGLDPAPAFLEQLTLTAD